MRSAEIFRPWGLYKYLQKMKNFAKSLFGGNQQKISDTPSYPTVSLTRWRSPLNYPNFGDDLSHTVVSLLLAQKGMTLEDEAHRATELLAIGSILHFAGSGAVVWGSGVNGKISQERHTYSNLDVRAVRGPLTREWLKEKRGIDAPEVYGDPALLLPELLGERFARTADGGSIFVPNLNDILTEVEFVMPADMRVVSPMQSWNRVVAEISRARFVAASSLHGLVLAEAFGIPARYVRLSEQENLFKYRDYYSGTGRDSFEFARTIPEAVEMGGVEPLKFDPAPLKSAFPVDLWIEAGA